MMKPLLRLAKCLLPGMSVIPSLIQDDAAVPQKLLKSCTECTATRKTIRCLPLVHYL
uniref:Uncharacterized protein n=1 Tax=Cyprinodon variegatus TaxID=28743 RepID=A0A3Q2D085_CYPVA